EAAGLHANPKLRCAYCRREEELPRDAAERHRHLRLRLMQVQRAREMHEAPLKTYQALKGSFVFGAGFAALFGAWQISSWLSNLGATARLQQPGLESAYLQSIVFAALGPALSVGMVAGYVGMSRAFKTAVLPLMRARPPQH